MAKRKPSKRQSKKIVVEKKVRKKVVRKPSTKKARTVNGYEKPNLAKALREVDKLPDNFFGNVSVNISDLPCLNKPKREKITINLDGDVIKRVKDIAKDNDTKYQTLINEALRKVFLEG